MTGWALRVTIIVPEAMRDDANDLAMVLGQGPADGATFGAAMFEDAAGNRYAVASTLARNTFPTAAASTLARPAWDVEPYEVNMTGAERAQDALAVYNPDAPVQAAPTRILAVVHPSATAALAAAGVTPIEVNV